MEEMEAHSTKHQINDSILLYMIDILIISIVASEYLSQGILVSKVHGFPFGYMN